MATSPPRPAEGSDAAAIDRLRLDPKRVEDMAQTLRDVAALADPIGEVITSSRRPNGLEVRQVRVPLGVIFMIYESRPNVTVDAAALCVKSGNAVILRGGKEAIYTNRALHRILADELAASGLPEHGVQLVPTTDRAAVGELLAMPEYIDLAIPRGGESLIRRVVAEAKMPVLKHYQGNCHVYVDARCDLDMAIKIILNAKVQRPGVCNAAETLLVHRAVAPYFLPRAAEALLAAGVELRGDPVARTFVPDMNRAEPADWDTEYLDKILAVGGRRIARRGDRPHHAPRLGAHRGDRHQRPRRRPPVRRRGRQLGRDGQRQHPIQRRRPARPGRRDRHQHRQDPRPRPLRPPRAHQHQVDRLRRRPHPRLKIRISRRDAERTAEGAEKRRKFTRDHFNGL